MREYGNPGIVGGPRDRRVAREFSKDSSAGPICFNHMYALECFSRAVARRIYSHCHESNLRAIRGPRQIIDTAVSSWFRHLPGVQPVKPCDIDSGGLGYLYSKRNAGAVWRPRWAKCRFRYPPQVRAVYTNSVKHLRGRRRYLCWVHFGQKSQPLPVG